METDGPGENTGNVPAGFYSGRTLSDVLGGVNTKAGNTSLESRKMDDAVVRQLASTIAPALTRYLPEEPMLRGVQACPEWRQWRLAFERRMDGQIFRVVWKTVDRPKPRRCSESGWSSRGR